MVVARSRASGPILLGLLGGLLVIAQTGLAPAVAGIPTGDWQIIEVRVDLQATRRLNYGPNDPRLRYRIAQIRANVVSFDTPEHSVCERPTWRARSVRVDELWRESFAGRGSAPEEPTARAWGFNFNDNEVVHADELSCAAGGFGPEDGGRPGTWFLVLSNSQLAVRWYDGTVLILKKMDDGEKPRASFNCSRARTSTEVAICRSHALAGLDRSIGEAYVVALKAAKDIDREAARTLVSKQEAWRRTRDDCGAEVQCLGQAMRKRLDEIAAEPE
jgi:uncharacterized protein YecT (DUF1311 family)